MAERKLISSHEDFDNYVWQGEARAKLKLHCSHEDYDNYALKRGVCWKHGAKKVASQSISPYCLVLQCVEVYLIRQTPTHKYVGTII